MNPTRVLAVNVRPGHTVRLEYGRTILIDVTEVHDEPQWVRFCGDLRHPSFGEAYETVNDSRHRHDGRMLVVADRNEPPAGTIGVWNDMDRLVRQWTAEGCTVWLLGNPDEPIGHGARLLGDVRSGACGWTWHAAYTDATGESVADYLDAERALIDATSTVNA